MLNQTFPKMQQLSGMVGKCCSKRLQLPPSIKTNSMELFFTWKPDSLLLLKTQQTFRRTMVLTTEQKPPLLEILRERVRSGELVYDVAQEKAAKRLSRLQRALLGYSNDDVIAHAEKELEKRRLQSEKKKEMRSDSVKENDTARNVPTDKEEILPIKSEESETSPIQIPRGLFIHGNVGIGKSFLMDLFYDNIPMHKKKRVHFHSFMQDVHKRIHKLKQKDLQTKGRNFGVDTSIESNPIHRVGVKLADEIALLCFDEFQVTDVADALILSQLFSVLFQRGTVIVATSNRHPSTLYEGGLNRGYFMPFIDLLCHHCIIHDIDASLDYRTLGAEGFESFFFSSLGGEESFCQYSNVLSNVWNEEKSHQQIIDVAFGRKLKVETTESGDKAKFTFQELCNIELGSSDYRAIADHFNLIIIEGIPQLSLKEPDQARRFITLVDELYEANCSLLCYAASDPSNLFVGKTGVDRFTLSTSCLSKSTSTTMSEYDNEKSLNTSESAEDIDVGETLGIDVAQSNGVTMGELASVRELSFAFRRAASRLKQMSCRKHWELNGIL